MEKLKRYFRILAERIKNKFIENRLDKLSGEEKFSLIYRTQYWLGFNKGSLSGSGSGFDETHKIRINLPIFLQKYQINTILDLPCGDFYWMSKVDLGNINYLGGDIVSDIIEENKLKYSNEKCSFTKLNLLEDSLPTVDLIFTRDCFVHLSNDQVLIAIQNIKRSGSKYFLTTTFEDVKENKVVYGGDMWRKINILLTPFNLLNPVEIIDDSFENGQDELKKMYLYEIKNL